jgi:hypothetical protein
VSLRYETEKYRWGKYTIIPEGEAFLLGEGYEPHRQFIGLFTADELLHYLRSAVISPPPTVNKRASLDDLDLGDL